MDRLLSYALIATIGLSASTIASAIVGDPFPVVVPAIAAGMAIAGHYQQKSDDDKGADDADVADAVSSVEQGDHA